jgi:hypothetical protein
MPEDLVRSKSSPQLGSSVPFGTAATRLTWCQPASITYDSFAAFHERNTMSNKAHLRPHQREQRASRVTRLLVAILIVTFVVLGAVLAATDPGIIRGLRLP